MDRIRKLLPVLGLCMCRRAGLSRSTCCQSSRCRIKGIILAVGCVLGVGVAVSRALGVWEFKDVGCFLSTTLAVVFLGFWTLAMLQLAWSAISRPNMEGFGDYD